MLRRKAAARRIGGKISGFSDKMRLKFCGKSKCLYICMLERRSALRTAEAKGSDGRVARHSSAKAATAVQIRFRPPKETALPIGNAVSLFYRILSNCSIVRRISLSLGALSFREPARYCS